MHTVFRIVLGIVGTGLIAFAFALEPANGLYVAWIAAVLTTAMVWTAALLLGRSSAHKEGGKLPWPSRKEADKEGK